MKKFLILLISFIFLSGCITINVNLIDKKLPIRKKEIQIDEEIN